MKKETAMALILVLIGGFALGRWSQQRQRRSEVPSPQVRKDQPSAAEIFELRTKCSELADKMVAEGHGAVGQALTSDTTPHYNPQTNRCYVAFMATKNFGFNYPKVPTNYRTVAVYDGQTKEQLVYARQEGDMSSGVIWTAAASNEKYVTYDRAVEEINKLMESNSY